MTLGAYVQPLTYITFRGASTTATNTGRDRDASNYSGPLALSNRAPTTQVRSVHRSKNEAVALQRQVSEAVAESDQWHNTRPQTVVIQFD
jgi:hypothetical protein